MKGPINKAILILLGVVTVVFLSAALSRRREPAYQGKPISWWIRTRNETALCQIGPQAIPFLIRNLEQQDSIFRKAALALWPRLPSIIHKKFSAHEPVPASAMKDAALFGLWQFGLEAKAATPKLLEMGHKEKDPYLRNFAKYTLAKVAPESPRALAAVIEMINDSNSDVRNSGHLALAHVASQAKPVVPVLMERLKAAHFTNSTSGIYGAAEIDALGRIGPEAQEAVPLLVDVLKSSKMQGNILNALEAIGPNAGEAVPTLVELLRSGEPGVKTGVIQALTAIGPKARLAVPALNGALGDENSVVRIMGSGLNI